MLYEQHLSKQKESLKKIEIMNKKILEESNKIKIKIEEELNLNLNRKQKNFKQISSQMELKIKEEIKKLSGKKRGTLSLSVETASRDSKPVSRHTSGLEPECWPWCTKCVGVVLGWW